jgi:alcohol dehydrogenase, propanol-preferring
MKAWRVKKPGPVESGPMEFGEVDRPKPERGEVLVRVRACGVCRTDLHVTEGDLAVRKEHVIPGHQIVGIVEEMGPEKVEEGAPGTRKTAGAKRRLKIGERVGIAWLHSTDGTCEYCRSGRENLCDHAEFTGWTVDGGYAEYALADEGFAYTIPEGFADEHAAPLLCAGIIGFRCLRVSGIERGGRLGFYGFGAAAHVAIQVARHWGVEVYASTRDVRHQKLAMELGAKWAGGTVAEPPEKLDAAIIFAPAGEIVPPALAALKKGGTLVLGGIHMSEIPAMDYDLLYGERVIRSVANNTRQDGEDFLRVAAEIPIHTEVESFSLSDADKALVRLKKDAITGAAVIRVAEK